MNSKTKLIMKLSKLNKLSCENAFKLSQKYEVSVKEIGKICNKEGVKIFGCQLGCFK